MREWNLRCYIVCDKQNENNRVPRQSKQKEITTAHKQLKNNRASALPNITRVHLGYKRVHWEVTANPLGESLVSRVKRRET